MSLDTKLLEDEINSEVKLLKDMEAGTDEYKVTIDGVTKLTDRYIELQKLKQQANSQVTAEAQRSQELALKREQLKSEKRGRVVSNILQGTTLLVTTGLTVWGTYKTMEFEKEGTVTTIFGREFFKNLFHKK